MFLGRRLGGGDGEEKERAHVGGGKSGEVVELLGGLMGKFGIIGIGPSESTIKRQKRNVYDIEGLEHADQGYEVGGARRALLWALLL